MLRRMFLQVTAAASAGAVFGTAPSTAPTGGSVTALLDCDLTDPVALTVALSNVESVSGNEGTIADAVERIVASLPGFDVVRLGNTVVARSHRGHARRFVFAGHLDTVPVAGHLPVQVREVDGVEALFGRGVADMKSGVAVMLSCMADAPRNVDTTWIFYEGEEVGGARNRLGRLARERPDLVVGDLAIVCEPTDATIELGCKGSLKARVVTTGRAAHAARDWMGSNAINAASPLLATLARHESETVVVDGMAYRECLNPVQITGGSTPNVIPDSCDTVIAYRFAPTRSIEDAKQVVREVLVGFDVEFTSEAGGAVPNAGPLGDVIRALDAPCSAKQGWTDVARFQSLGIPALNYGPGASLSAHGDDEHCPVWQITACVDGIRRVLRAGG